MKNINEKLSIFRKMMAAALLMGSLTLSAQNFGGPQGPSSPFGGPNNPTGIPGQAPFTPPAQPPFTKPLINNGWASQGGNWGPGMNMPPAGVPTPVVMTSGKMRVVACGYDITGVWRIVPMVVRYHYNGIQYIVTMLSAWNPVTQMWMTNVDVQAFNTSYYLRGVNYSYYTVLSTGTFYFNL